MKAKVFALAAALLVTAVSVCSCKIRENGKTEVCVNGTENTVQADKDNFEKANTENISVNIRDKDYSGDIMEGKFLPIKMFMADGRLYYDTGEVSKKSRKCGTLDGNINSVCGEFELPKKDGCANFEVKNKDYFGWQNTGEETKEVPFEDGWRIFKRIDLLGNDISEFCGCVRVADEKEYVMLTVNSIACGKDGSSPLYIKPDGADKDLVIPVKYGRVYDWGIVMSAQNVTSFGMTLIIERIGGNKATKLGTGSEYRLEVQQGDMWQSLPYKTDNIAWNAVLYLIDENVPYKEEISWEQIYGKLPEGKYRIYKDILGRQGAKDNKHRYYLEFEIKEAAK